MLECTVLETNVDIMPLILQCQDSICKSTAGPLVGQRERTKESSSSMTRASYLQCYNIMSV